ncbi:hypothetical protein ALC62_09086 [Cyphomyrmex costatus]|uniref:Phospholipase A2-like domain-containing protein n=1 Tax=Cyphomyrmex costatus TaxID=456900 RepID=A0A151IG09_9HYME|nr:hypothetical protein ALC62_09086 [Cyphomyrmex costatus]
MDVTSGSLAISNTSSTDGAWSYDNSRDPDILDISFKVDGTVIYLFNADFTGVDACIGLSYEAFGRFRFGFGSSSFSEKNGSTLMGSFGDSTVFSTICFNGSVIGLKGLLNKAINALSFELHIPGYQFCGPGTRLEKRLARGDRGINLLDTTCREHDIAYSHNNGLTERHVADNILAEKARKRITARDSSLTERAAATAVWAAMKAKTKMGMGLKTKKRKSKRILPIAKRGGILPVLPLLGVLGSLVDGAAGVAKAVNDSRAAERQLEEMQRHNRVMEGHGVYLASYKRGRGVVKRKKKTSMRR